MIVKCPTCAKEVVWENNPFRPFCSERCKLIDLDKWLKGEYSIPLYEEESNTPKDEENS
jgi:endogenous inhibitor of DNA gyrase (YacG/DUF329 family)